MEATQVETQPPLFSLNGSVYDHLLSYVASGEGGLQSILNLRRVCTTTKSWIDDLPRAQAARLFSKAQASLTLSKFALKEFLDTPPPPGVTSLKILNTEYLRRHKQIPKHIRLWSKFVIFWESRLKFLTIDVSSFPPTNMHGFEQLKHLLGPRGKVDLHCNLLQGTDAIDDLYPSNRRWNWNEFTGISNTFSLVRNLSIDCFERKPDATLFHQLSKIPNLKSLRFKLCVQRREPLKGIKFLVNAKKGNAEFQLTMELELDRTSSNERQEQIRVGFWKILTSVAASASSIKIIGMNMWELLPPEEILEPQMLLRREKTAKKFYSQVEWIQHFEELEHFRLEKLSLFPNLRRLDSLNVHFGDPENFLQQFTSFPPNLRRLGISRGFPLTRSLPKGLTYLNLIDLSFNCLAWTSVEVSDSMTAIGECCPLLNKLKVSCKSFSMLARSNGPPRNLTNLFKNLKSLSVKLNVGPNWTQENDDFGPYIRCVLLNIFHVDQLHLYKLKFSERSFRGALLQIDSETLCSLIDGPIATSLLSLRITASNVEPEAFPLLNELHSITASNRRKRLLTHGRTCRKHHFYD